MSFTLRNSTSLGTLGTLHYIAFFISVDGSNNKESLMIDRQIDIIIFYFVIIDNSVTKSYTKIKI